MTIADDKAAARKVAFAVRKVAFAVGQGDAALHLAQALAPHGGNVLSGYMPMRTEIDPLAAMAGHAGPVCVPVIIGKARPLAFRQWSLHAEMTGGEFGALIPAAGDWLEPQVLIVPLLAWDRRGYRLGYGGGYYDRTLQGLRALRPTVAIGFAFAAQEVAEVPIDATDQRLNMVVTEAGVVRIGQGPGAADKGTSG